MRDLVDYLQDPELVARFQRRCGLFLVEATHHSRGKTTTTTHDPTDTEIRQQRARLRAKWEQQDQNSNFTHEANGYAAKVSCLATRES